MPSTLAQSKERKGSNYTIWQPCFSDAAVAGEEFLRRPSIEAIVMRMTTQPPPLTAASPTAAATTGGRGSSPPRLIAAAPTLAVVTPTLVQGGNSFI